MPEEYTPTASQLVTGMVALAGVFAEVLEAVHPDLRGQLEAVAEREFRRFQDQEEHRHTAVVLMLFLQKLHAQSLEGRHDSEPNIRNKLARGKFTAVFLIQCLEAIGASQLRLD